MQATSWKTTARGLVYSYKGNLLKTINYLLSTGYNYYENNIFEVVNQETDMITIVQLGAQWNYPSIVQAAIGISVFKDWMLKRYNVYNSLNAVTDSWLYYTKDINWNFIFSSFYTNCGYSRVRLKVSWDGAVSSGDFCKSSVNHWRLLPWKNYIIGTDGYYFRWKTIYKTPNNTLNPAFPILKAFTFSENINDFYINASKAKLSLVKAHIQQINTFIHMIYLTTMTL